MALFDKSGNPAFQDKLYQGTIFQGITTGEEMTVGGTMKKFAVLFALMMATTCYAWTQTYNGNVNPMTFLWVGIIAGVIISITMAVKKQWSPFLAPAWALVEGLFVGAISAVYDFSFKTSYPGLVMQAVGLTFIVALVMFACYYTRLIKVTEKFKTIIIIATASVMIFYLLKFILGAFGVTIGAFTNAATPLGIGFSVVVVVLAALNLLLDFDMIEKGAEKKMPKFMEWYSASALLFTLVWLYLEILRLLSKIKQ